jgi:hypothetical protein
LDFLTPQFFDLLIIVVIIVGLALAAVRLYADFTRPLPPPRPPIVEPPRSDDDTQPTA